MYLGTFNSARQIKKKTNGFKKKKNMFWLSYFKLISVLISKVS